MCDKDADGQRAVGWIAVRRPNGHWNQFPTVEAAGGNGTCTTVNFNVKRERAKVKIVACRQNGRDGVPHNCGSKRCGEPDTPCRRNR